MNVTLVTGPRTNSMTKVVILLMVWVAFSLDVFAEDPQLQFTKVSDRGGIVDIANAGDGSGRLFLVEQFGRIFILENGKDLDTPFLNFTSKVMAEEEQGLLSMAFAPDFITSGYFYIYNPNPLVYISPLPMRDMV